ncbi:CHITIN SYNTHASE 1 [Encephalitozoon cuniculi GB-M1]|uniref:Chitin synthase 1 n=1 Tax=Encephalitozoon cuniculi (strain GB-M1) TaxID=284813 RepID=CHS1_ENCCU|nr:chitin synthase 1 [Encephalitozoon cuniculi GB-M1]Q8SSI7.1 RecName: Full=Chitin synthase 1; AltName: Full=Chitin-UDP acetyl-glucosaminyl transferase 1; AltName: Full=Class-IV chitin synthase 1 [Encephalitozoon cuniculi GB-M1]CAD25012.1 CHITIN SYNTHASE 1 [Encephalitozoon cuniculi GB-M1]
MLSQGEILRNPSRTRLQRPPKSRSERKGWWYRVTIFLTCLIPNFMLRCFGMTTPEVQHAWREKVALCICIFFCWIILGFTTYGMNTIICKGSNQYVASRLKRDAFDGNTVIANGGIYYTDDEYAFGENHTYAFEKKSGACKLAFGRQLPSGDEDIDDLERINDIYWDWGDIMSKGMIVVGNKVYDPSYCTEPLFEEFNRKYAGTEGKPDFDTDEWRCYEDMFYAGKVATKTPGCLLADTMFWITTISIFGLIITKFLLGFFYSWYAKRRPKPSPKITPCILLVTCYSEGKDGIKNTLDSLCKQDYGYDYKLIVVICDGNITGSGNSMSTPDIVLGLSDVDRRAEPKGYISLTHGTKRYNRAKVHAGYYHVREEKKSRRYRCWPCFGRQADSSEVENYKTRILVINKCGNPSETFKAGNRGKRDSQVILMSFFSKLIYGDRMTELDFEIYQKMKFLMPHIEPEDFECILMVDADTIVKPDALSIMVNVFETDQKVIGMCGETMILNKFESWVTMIQVFEYYISHHLSKAFESVFGGVTCLPGCFCMYRIKIVTNQQGQLLSGPSKSRASVPRFSSMKSILSSSLEKSLCLPILANPAIINAYSVLEVKTLHQKNLLHLGEDRYLTTLLLKTFYRRKLVFIPAAKCETYVPGEFSVLLSQRRRWINSTIHNLFELVQVNNLCGAFCFSMQLVVVMELFGTLVLPAAIIFTFVMIAVSILIEPAWVPLIMLVGIFGLPAVLILITTMEIQYVFWCLVYILSIPIWNFVLPTYAFWHFDNFSWGDTRKVDGEGKEDEEGEFDHTKIRIRELEEFLSEANK